MVDVDLVSGTRPASIFLSKAAARLDEKGRLVLPARYRPALTAGLVCTRGLDRCIYVLPLAEFLAIYERIRSAPDEDDATREYIRGFLSEASDEAPDKQGRVMLPVDLRRYAGIDRDVMVAGNGARLEIWDAATYEERRIASEANYAAAAKEVARYYPR